MVEEEEREEEEEEEDAETIMTIRKQIAVGKTRRRR